MTLAEFIRLRPSADDDPGDAQRRTFVCEMPDADGDSEDAWLDCGRVDAFATHGCLDFIDIQLTEVFARQFDNARYDPEEVLGIIILWVGWESKWTAIDKVRIRLRDGQGTLDCAYIPATDRVNCMAKLP